VRLEPAPGLEARLAIVQTGLAADCFLCLPSAATVVRRGWRGRQAGAVRGGVSMCS